MKILKFLFVFLLSLGVFVADPVSVFASETNGTVSSSYKYAWSDMSGWVNFGLILGNVHVTDDGLTGYAWTENHGWISLSPTDNGGVSNDGEGDLSGFAWGEQLGWIDFGDVSIDSNGRFHGEAVVMDVDGSIIFDCDYCDVRTDWRQESGRVGGSGTSGNISEGNNNSGNSTDGPNNNDTSDIDNYNVEIVTGLSENDVFPDDIIDLVQPSCGDGICSSVEGCTTCARDCGACVITPVCGDNICNGGETCGGCSNDCGICDVFEVNDLLSDAITTIADEILAIYVEDQDIMDVSDRVFIGIGESPSDLPLNISDIDTRDVYTNSSYEREALNLILDDKSNCGGSKSIDCFKNVYGLENIEGERPLTDKEIGDAIVFNKYPKEVIEVPRIVNLSGKVGSQPAILFVSKPDDYVVIGILRKKNDGTFLAVRRDQITLDEEGKGVLRIENPLSDGQYYAVIYAMRNGVKINGKGAVFEVDTAIDNEFNVDDFEIIEDPGNVEINRIELSEFGAFLLSYIETYTDGKFVANEYVGFVKESMKKYIVKGNVNSEEIRDMVVYITYESVILGSVVISDAATKGSFHSVVSSNFSKGEHTITIYAYDPKTKKMTSMKVKKFVKK